MDRNDIPTQIGYIKTMGCNAVWIGVWGPSWGGYPDVYSNEIFWTKLDIIMSVTSYIGLYVVFRGFVAAGSLTDDVTVDFVVSTMTSVAQRYASYNHIIYEPVAEVLYMPESTYTAMIQQCIDGIRTYRADAVVSVAAESPASWTVDFGFQQNYPINRPNIIFSGDPYGYFTYSDNSQTAIRNALNNYFFFDWIHAQGFPSILSEFGGHNEGGPSEWSNTWVTNCMIVCDTDGYSGYGAWRWITPTDENTYYLISDWSGTLSTYGTVISDYYLANEPEPSPSPTPTPTPTPTHTPTSTPRSYPLLSYPSSSEILVQGSGFNIYVDVIGGGLAFQHAMVNKTFTIEVLTGVWNGTDCTLGMTERGGTLTFHSNDVAEVQLSHTAEYNMRLNYEGILLSVIEVGHSWNGTIPADTDVYLHWSFSFLMPHEENFMFLIGLFGIALFVGGILFTAYLVKVTPIFSFGTKEILFEKESFIIGLAVAFIGAGLIMVWLMG